MSLQLYPQSPVVRHLFPVHQNEVCVVRRQFVRSHLLVREPKSRVLVQVCFSRSEPHVHGLIHYVRYFRAVAAEAILVREVSVLHLDVVCGALGRGLNVNGFYGDP